MISETNCLELSLYLELPREAEKGELFGDNLSLSEVSNLNLTVACFFWQQNIVILNLIQNPGHTCLAML